MPLTEDQAISILRGTLDDAERAGGVAAMADSTVSAGTTMRFPGVTIAVEQTSWIGFVDRDPMANWGHQCRYVLIDAATGDTHSISAQLPPYGPTGTLRWRQAFKASSVPEAVLPAALRR